MLGLELLGIAIGTIFVYLLLSLICTALTEFIELLLKRRASDLELGIRQLLGDEAFARRLYEHPLIFGLYQDGYNPKNKKNLPSYIPARLFTLALLDLVWPTSGTPGGTTPPEAGAAPQSLAALRAAVDSLANPHVRGALLPLINAAGDSLDQARANVEEWYNSQMDRVAGWYKRQSQMIVLGLGIVIAIAVNADTIAIIKSLSTDAALRDALVSVAQEYARTEGAPASDPAPDQSSPIEACRRDQSSPECRIERHLAQIRQLGLPLGWEFTNPRSIPPLSDIPAWLFKLGGWLITAFAISLGAPFWFDLLNKFTVIRSTVKPTEKSPEEKSKD